MVNDDPPPDIYVNVELLNEYLYPITPAPIVSPSIFTVNVAFPGTTLAITGAPGILYGKNWLDAADAEDIPAALIARTVTV